MFRSAFLGGALVLALCAHAACAADAPLEAKAKLKPGPHILSPDAIDPLRLLPPPPPEGSEVQKTELAELHHLQATRTPEEFARAKWNADHEDASAFASAMGPKFDLAALPATARLLTEVRNEQASISKLAKQEFHRTRPFVVDAAIVGCEHGNDRAKSAYPSGHATLGYTLAVVMAGIAPEHAQPVLQRAADYAHDRLVCGAHFRSDIVAGQAMGTAIGVELLQAPALQADIAAAKQELAAAGVR
ncbi:MAG: phosphatase PAP2 family protein [Caulobacteraceae bacterium]